MTRIIVGTLMVLLTGCVTKPTTKSEPEVSQVSAEAVETVVGNLGPDAPVDMVSRGQAVYWTIWLNDLKTCRLQVQIRDIRTVVNGVDPRICRRSDEKDNDQAPVTK